MIDEAIDAAAANLDSLTSERWIRDGGASLETRAHADDAGTYETRPDTQLLGGERNADVLRFAYVQSLRRPVLGHEAMS